MLKESPVLQLSPTETLTAVVDSGKLAYEYKQAVNATYEFRDGKMREKTKPIFETKLLQGIIPAELFRTKPDEVMAFFKEQVDLCKPA